MGGNSDTTARLSVTLLGTFEVRRDGEPVAVPGARLRALITRLALAGGRAVGPATLAGALWPDERPGDPANALQSLVSRLRRMLGDAGAVTQSDGGYRLSVTPDDVDALRLDRLAAAGRERLRAGDPRAAAALLGEAAGLWHGEPAAVAEVAPATAAQLTRTAAEAATDLAEAELAGGAADAATARLTALLDQRPADERVAALLIDALAAQGRQADALAIYERVRAALADRLGADPGAALRERHLRLLRTAGPAGDAAGSPAASSPAPAAVAGNLPAPVSSFVGRDDDLDRIDTLLTTGRLVTVVGPGGAGKTRLAVEAARRRRHEYRDGAWLVDLASVTEPAKVTTAVIAAIGIRAAALFENRLGTGHELTEHLAGRETLLVVDNCEHLIDAVAHLLATLLPRCARLRVLATSREPLAIDGETLVPLGPLTLPAPADDLPAIRRAAAVRLFAERAAAVRPGFDVDEDTRDDVVRVVHGLDGMPLALELAAARLRTLSLDGLAAGLSDRFRLLTSGTRTAAPRHRTLRAVIAWSWDLLTTDERALADRVSVLPGGVTTASAVAVTTGTGIPPADVPALIAALVDKSLLHLGGEPGRYRMLETLREYGTEQLAAAGTLHATRTLAAAHLAGLVARNDARLRGPDQLVALCVLRAEYDNALAALRHLCDSGDAGAAINLALNLGWYWQMLGRHTDAAYWLGEALALPGTGGGLPRDVATAVYLLNKVGDRSGSIAEAAAGRMDELRAAVDRLLTYPRLPGLAGAVTAMMLFFLQENDAATRVIERVIDGPDRWAAGLGRLFRSQAAENQGDLDQVRTDVTAALECFDTVGDRWGLAVALPMRAMLREYDGDLDGALADLSKARTLAGEFGSLSLSDEIFIDLRWIDLHMRRGDTAAALAMTAQARAKAARAGSRELGILIEALEAGVRVRVGEIDRATELVEKAEAEMAAEMPFGGDHGRAITGAVRALVCLRRGDGPGAEEALARAYAAAVETRDMPMMSLVAVTAAALADHYGRHRETALLLGAAARLRGAHDHTDADVRELSGRSRAALGEAAFADAYQQGWQVDGKTASARIDPARLRREALPGPQARRA